MTYKLPSPSKSIIESEKLGVKVGQDLSDAENDLRQSLRDSTEFNNSDSRAEAILRGEELPPRLDRSAAITQMRERVADLKAAQALHAERHAKLMKDEERRIKAEIKPDVDALAKRFSSGLADAFESLAKIEKIQGALMGRGFNGASIFPIDTEHVFREGTHRTSYAALLLRDLHQHGYLENLPESAR